MTPEPEESVYSLVATLRSLRIIIFLAELNGLQLMQGDIGNAYLESYMQEKVYFTAGPEFGHLVGHNYIIDKALYGLRSSGLHFLNKTPIDAFSKRQNQVESATYGSEFMAARQAVEQIIDLQYSLCMFGVPIDGTSWLFGDNKSVVTSSTIPHSTLNKRWNALSYHKVREAVAGNIV